MNITPRRKLGVELIVGCGLFFATSSSADAHLSVEGMDAMASGALHPWMSPAHVLMFLSLALLLGQQVPFELKVPSRIFASVSAAALLFTLTRRVEEVDQALLVGVALVIAILVTLETKIPRWLCGCLCGAAAAGIGLDSMPSEDSALKTLAGTWLSLNAGLLYLAMCASHGAHKKWLRIAIRVIGSWIIAIALMVLAFSLRQ